MTTATEFPTTLTNGRTAYTVEYAPAIKTKRGPSFYLRGARGALYALMPAINFDPTAPVWVTVPSKAHVPFDFVTMTDGAWSVIK